MQVAVVRERERRGNGDTASSLGEDAGRFGEQPDAVDQRLIRHGARPAAAVANRLRGERSVSGIPDRDRARDRVRNLGDDVVVAALEKAHDRRAPLRLRAVEAGRCA